jgi:hypothetical protein
MKRNITLLLFVFFLIKNNSQAQTVKAFYVGHSLSDQIPDMVKSLSDDHPTVDFNWVYQSIPGAPLRWQWERKAANDYRTIDPHYYGFYNTTNGLPNGKFDVMVLTESVPRIKANINDTYQYADSFFVYAKRFNPDIQVYLYEDWHCLLSGTPTRCAWDVNSNPWRQRIKDDLPMWESVVDTLNRRYKPTKSVCMIPAAQGLGRLYDSIQAKVVPEISKIENLFSDDIHLNDTGKYFIACIHFAMIHKKSPVGLTNKTKVWWGGDFKAPSVATATKLQQIAWQTVVSYPKTCLGKVTSDTEVNPEKAFTVFPNPATSTLTVTSENSDIQPYFIYNLFGQLVQSGKEKSIDISHLSNGLYFIKINHRVVKFLKKS